VQARIFFLYLISAMLHILLRTGGPFAGDAEKLLRKN
jgi:hypothetical protein